MDLRRALKPRDIVSCQNEETAVLRRVFRPGQANSRGAVGVDGADTKKKDSSGSRKLYSIVTNWPRQERLCGGV